MATAIELINSKTIGRDRRAVWRGQRRFKIHGGAIDASDFLADPPGQTNGVCPAYFSTWPSGPGSLVLDSYDVQPNDNVLDVVANYSSDGTFRFPERVQKFDNLPLWRSWSGSTLDETIKFPYAAKTTTRDTSTGATYTSWVVQGDLEIKTAMRVHTRPVALVSTQIDSAIVVMEQQHNKLHLINGFWYRFEAGAYSEIEPDKWEVNYTWTYDPGHQSVRVANAALPLITFPGDPDAPVSWFDPDGLGYNAPAWVRPPFCEFTVIFNTDPAERPAFPPFRPYAFGNRGGVDPTVPTGDGWKDLPNVGI